jgi:hypothetical protein
MFKDRRSFIKTSATGLVSLSAISYPFTQSDLCGEKTKLSERNIVGPKEGYTPHIGALISVMNWMREVILQPVRGLSVAELDYLHDDNANSIGAMLWHLAATERFYQLNTLEGRTWGNWPEKDDKEFSIAMSLGDNGRKELKGQSLDFYLEKLERVRNISLEAFKEKDDEWFLKPDEGWFWGPTNDYCKWFHVVEHESNHNGQIKFIKSRIEL